MDGGGSKSAGAPALLKVRQIATRKLIVPGYQRERCVGRRLCGLCVCLAASSCEDTRMWGELWEFPFRVGVWGNAAAWFGAIGTVASFAAAASFYVADSLKERSAQARRVRFVLDIDWVMEARPEDKNMNVVVHNYSEDSIYDVSFEWQRVSLEKALMSAFDEAGGAIAYEQRRAIYEDWLLCGEGGSTLNLLRQRRLEPGGQKTAELQLSRYHVDWVKFYDALGRRWKLKLGSASPVRVKERRRNRLSAAVDRDFRRARRDNRRWIRSLES